MRGDAMDLTAVPETVATMVAAGGVKELAEAAGGGLVAGIVERLRKVFGADARSVDALDRARRDGTPAAIAELASALAWYAQRNQEFADELAGWAAEGNAAGLVQNVRAGRDAYVSGRDQTIINYRRPDE
jgi:hypothetical protein